MVAARRINFDTFLVFQIDRSSVSTASKLDTYCTFVKRKEKKKKEEEEQGKKGNRRKRRLIRELILVSFYDATLTSGADDACHVL